MLCQACTAVLEERRDFLRWTLDVSVPDDNSSTVSSGSSRRCSVDEEQGQDKDSKEGANGELHTQADRVVAESDIEIAKQPLKSSQDHYTTPVYGHHRSFSGLQAAAEEWCQVCRVLWDCLTGSEQREALVAITREGVQPAAAVGPIFVTEMQVMAYPFWEYSVKVWFSRETSVPAIRTTAHFILYPQTGRPLPIELASKDRQYSWYDPAPVREDLATASSTLSQGSLRLAKEWLKECLDHSACAAGTDPWVPTRLLDLKPQPSAAEDTLCLVLEGEVDLREPYTTLSHRWGTATLLKLTRAKLEQFCDTIPVSDLPKTFQQAVRVSRELGVRYLWIDSLCIVQDDASVRARESSEMHHIYANSYCNLAASDSMDSSGGLERQRHPSMIQACKVALGGHVPDQYGIMCGIYTLENQDLFEQDVDKCALNERAWVLQERFLAPRVLHFTRYQLYWECRTCIKCEKYPSGIVSDRLAHGVFIKRRDIFGDQNLTKLHECWKDIAWTYSKTFLTYPSDKLVALSGVAKLFRSTTKDEYVAGLWRKNFEDQLLWHRMHPATGHSLVRPSEYRAPSWSWMSLDGPMEISVFQARTEFDIVIEDICLKYASKDDTGQLLGGWLDLSGQLKPVRMACDRTLRRSDPWRCRWKAFMNDGPLDFVGAILDEPHVEERVMMSYSNNGDLFCIPVWSSKSSSWGTTATWTWNYSWSLLLRLVNRQTNEFERIGLGRSQDNTAIGALYKELDEEVKKTLPCLRYEQGRHTIRII